MAVRSSDLAPGAKVESQGYVREEGYVAAYQREFSRAHVGRAPIAYLLSEVALDKKAEEASGSFALLELILSSKDARDELSRQFVQAARRGAPSVRIRKVTVGRLRTYRVGTGALMLPVTMRTRVGRIHGAVAFAAVDRVEVTLVTIAAPGRRLAPAAVISLVRGMAAHIVSGLSPILLAPPGLSGVASLGQTLSAAPGSWANPPVAIAYQWQRCDVSGAGCASIPGATGQSYNVGLGDVGATLRVVVTASNTVGSASAASPATAAAT